MAPPPPATPTPHRFLVPKRSQQPRQETPKPKTFQPGGQQFQATPRFALHSTPRGSGSGLGSAGGAPSHLSSSARTPASVSSGAVGAGAFFRPTPRNTDPINDVTSSPPFLEGGPSGGGKKRDPIDISTSIDEDEDADEDVGEGEDEEAVPESSPIRGSSHRGASSEREEDDMISRSPKRRRISISSSFDIESSQQHGHQRSADEDIDMIQSSFPLPHLPPFLTLPPSRPASPSPSPSSSSSPTHTDAAADILLSSSPLTLTPKPAAAAGPLQQPTFQKAPRFKPADALEGSHGRAMHEPPPDVFSPHRRRDAKYIGGGLAAEVRDWFVDVWAGTGAGTTRRDGGGAGWVARVRVEEVRSAPGAVLVTGWHLRGGDDGADGEGNGGGDGDEDGDGDGDVAASGNVRVRVVLAGSPKLTGLARREDVKPGSVVGIGRPSWEVSIQDQGRWGVVCEWAVLS
ncbi:hypothetical protein GGR53DRAFT_398271 [Hypoxylon sp. FL1150]|nr:hypothetical protein GGR53DRAFT_398271 [Hypoxylon sp. FL1150]